MPVRFQVDPDFYDHPKVTGMSDAAFSLWVRAGSYSAAKLTDGFVSEDVLAHALQADVEVAEELVQRGLWRRRRGGYVFHQWATRNLTRARVEADKKADARRKRLARKQTRSTEPETQSIQVNGQNVRPDSGRSPPAVPPESDTNPAVSVSSSVSVSSGGSFGRGSHVDQRARDEQPPPRCPKHLDQPAAGPCGPCGDARRARDQFDQHAHKQHRATVRACQLCDIDGWRYEPGRRVPITPYQHCDHTPLNQENHDANPDEPRRRGQTPRQDDHTQPGGTDA